MKKTIFLFVLFFAFSLHAQDSYDLSTLRIGPFTFGMKQSGFNKIYGAKYSASKDKYGNKVTIVNYNGEKIELQLYKEYSNEETTTDFIVHQLSTKSSKFKTKSGMGVGNTKTELFETYKNYPNITIMQMWDEKTEKKSTTESAFTLMDTESNTELSFRLRNNVVSEIVIYSTECC